MLVASVGGGRPVVAMLLFDDVEVLDFAGPFEVFAAARNESGEPFTTIFTVAGQPEVVATAGCVSLRTRAWMPVRPSTCSLSRAAPGRGYRARVKNH